MEEAVLRELSEKRRGHKTSEKIGRKNESEERARRRRKKGGRDSKRRRESCEGSSSVNSQVSGVQNSRTTYRETS